MKIAVVHDHFTQLGGAERVAEALAGLLPGFHSIHNGSRGERDATPRFRGADVHTSWMRHLPAMNHHRIATIYLSTHWRLHRSILPATISW